ncbi:hypothetical protein RFN57_04105 [Streptomyces violaceochromogenes]|uniref:Uncharacterized protein n=1 Tax=Streptomyces violaceochromogenes TaxID=67377 RepID=A0ABU6LQU3_9ACTN|nr:hypothetical protein [Streptomyces violaceochromogenes]MEC7051473.1 hypothetical protein [Streptomyces violaceochromogenes]GHC90742.1 hypothetical protein GCM10010309_72880 [Streptomyces violaceochromogenes]
MVAIAATSHGAESADRQTERQHPGDGVDAGDDPAALAQCGSRGSRGWALSAKAEASSSPMNGTDMKVPSQE